MMSSATVPPFCKGFLSFFLSTYCYIEYYRLQPSCRKSRFSMKDTTRSSRMHLEQKVVGKVDIRIVVAIQATDFPTFQGL